MNWKFFRRKTITGLMVTMLFSQCFSVYAGELDVDEFQENVVDVEHDSVAEIVPEEQSDSQNPEALDTEEMVDVDEDVLCGEACFGGNHDFGNPEFMVDTEHYYDAEQKVVRYSCKNCNVYYQMCYEKKGEELALFEATSYSDRDVFEEITIPSTINGFKVTSIHSLNKHKAFSNLENLYLSDGLKTIDGFEDCTNLHTVHLPNTLERIGAWAFVRCTSLENVELPSGLKEISINAFEGCKSLTSITIPRGVNVDNYAFMDCAGLKSVILPDNMDIIHVGTFKNCKNLESISIPDTVTQIDKEAFWGCEKLKKLTISPNVKIINFDAFGITSRKSMDDYITDPEFVCYGYSGTSAERFCNQHGIRFVSLGSGAGYKPQPDGSSSSKPSSNSGAAFIDVPNGKFYTDAVNWAVGKGVTTGTSKTTFSPDDSCTRAQVVTFLWRAMGSPEPTIGNSPFSDVQDASKYYYKPILWAVGNGITTGTSKTTFSPNDTVTRGQFVTFLYRAKGSPAGSSNNPFNDVQGNKFYAKPVLWAYSTGVTTGTSKTTFSPENPCTRGQVVTFIYRALK